MEAHSGYQSKATNTLSIKAIESFCFSDGFCSIFHVGFVYEVNISLENSSELIQILTNSSHGHWPEVTITLSIKSHRKLQLFRWLLLNISH